VRPIQRAAARQDDGPRRPPVSHVLFANAHDVTRGRIRRELAGLDLLHDAERGEQADVLPAGDEAAPGEEIPDLLLEVAKSSTGPKTYQEYEGICERYLIPRLGTGRLIKLTAVEVETFYAHLLLKGRKDGKAGLSPRTVIHCHRLLHKAFEDAVKKNRDVAHSR
jgi:hypothetical protein